jgi:hypothetical protein
MREQHWRSGKRKITKDMGWWTDDKSKEVMFAEFIRSVKRGEFIVHSDKLVEECGQYVRLAGKIEHNQAVNTDDDSSKGKAHGDRVMAIGVGIMAARRRPHGAEAAKQEVESNPTPGTMAARMKAREEAELEATSDWDDRDNYDLAHKNHRRY